MSFLFVCELSSSITAGSVIEPAAAMAVVRIDPLSGARGASFLKESCASGVFTSDLDMTSGVHGFEAAPAPFSTASFSLYVDAMGYVDYAGCAADDPPPPATPLPPAGALAAPGLGRFANAARRRKAKG